MWLWSSTLFRSVGPALLALAFLGCGSEGESGTTGPEASFSISAPPSLTVEAGSSGSVPVTVTRSGWFSNAVTVTLEDHPSDLTHDVPAAYRTTSTVTVAFSVAVGMAPGTYLIKACGRALGLERQCAEIRLTVTPAAFGTFTLSLDPASLTIAAGHTGNVAITLRREGAFVGSVTLDIATFSSHPGITFSFEPAVIPAGSTSATLTITAAADAPAMVSTGWNALWVVGRSTHFRHDAPLLLTVTSPAGAVLLALAPGGLTVEQRKTGTTTATITRVPHFDGEVTLALEGAPAGVTGSFVPTVVPVGASAATLTVSVGGDVPGGTHVLTIRGTGDGVVDATAMLVLRVTYAPAMTMTLEPASLSLGAGQKATVAITLARAVWFDEPVTLDIACWCDPPGVTFTFDPAVIPGGANTATATVTVAANAPPFVYTGEDQLWIVGISPSGRRYDAIFHLTVTPP